MRQDHLWQNVANSRATRSGFASWRHGILGIISSAQFIMSPIRGRLIIRTHMSHWKNHDPFEVWSIYFERLAQAAESGLFEIIGHADLPKKFKIYPAQDCTPLYERFLDRAAKTNVAVELNTAGLRKDCREIYPCRDLCWKGRRAGTFPSPSGPTPTRRQEVGSDFAAAVDLARSVGYTHWRRFTARKFAETPL
jgi:histidinol-phosphatase (PHP family)